MVQYSTFGTVELLLRVTTIQTLATAPWRALTGLVFLSTSDQSTKGIGWQYENARLAGMMYANSTGCGKCTTVHTVSSNCKPTKLLSHTTSPVAQINVESISPSLRQLTIWDARKAVSSITSSCTLPLVETGPPHLPGQGSA